MKSNKFPWAFPFNCDNCQQAPISNERDSKF